jgi:TonB family protein
LLAPLFAAAVVVATPHVITTPDWLSKPSGADLVALYPPAAAASHLSGRAVLACVVDAEGALQDCTAPMETPPGAGFGAAALAMATRFRMRPMSRDGVPVAGAKVRIPINFAIAPPPTLAAAASAPTSELPVDSGCTPRLAGISRYPDAAHRMKLQGHVVLNCDVSGYRPSDCRVVSETPQGAGFALAALATAQCHMNVTGRAPGRRDLPINFKLGRP